MFATQAGFPRPGLGLYRPFEPIEWSQTSKARNMERRSHKPETQNSEFKQVNTASQAFQVVEKALHSRSWVAFVDSVL